MTEWKNHLKALSWAAVVWGAIAALFVAAGFAVHFFGPLAIVPLAVAGLFFLTYRSALRYIREKS